MKNELGEDISFNKTTVIVDAKGNTIEETDYCNNGKHIIKRTYAYDNKDNQVEKISYNDDGTIWRKYYYKYDDKGNEIEEAAFGSNGNLHFNVISLYDSNGNMIEWTTYNSNGSIRNRTLSKYDDKGNIIEKVKYDANGAMQSKSCWKHISENLREHARYYADGSLNSKSICKYDCKDNLIESISYDRNGDLSDKSFYKYDSRGNEIEAEHYSYGDLEYKSIYKYDDNGNLIEEKSYDENGNLRSITVRERIQVGEENNREQIAKPTETMPERAKSKSRGTKLSDLKVNRSEPQPELSFDERFDIAVQHLLTIEKDISGPKISQVAERPATDATKTRTVPHKSDNNISDANSMESFINRTNKEAEKAFLEKYKPYIKAVEDTIASDRNEGVSDKAEAEMLNFLASKRKQGLKFSRTGEQDFPSAKDVLNFKKKNKE